MRIKASRISIGYKARAVAMIIAVSALVGATPVTSWASGVSVSSDAAMMADTAAQYPLQFDAALQNSLVELQAASPAASVAATAFYATYTASTRQYGSELLDAAQVYLQNYQADPAGAKNTYVDSFSRARATYFGSLEAARNDVVTKLSDTDERAKNMFVGEYNAARDEYNNQLESIKNQIASLN